MENKIKPILQSTKYSNSLHEWLPSNFSNFMKELEHISRTFSRLESKPLFRGQKISEWHLDSTFARNTIEFLLCRTGLDTFNQEIRKSLEFQNAAVSLLMLNFRKTLTPSKELRKYELTHDTDPYFELMKNIQQYPENYHLHVKGSFLVDWTKSSNVALFFANEDRVNHGSVWIFSSASTGKILQVKEVEKIFELMEAHNYSESACMPLMFHPPNQLEQKRAVNQEVVYIAQTDFRLDLSNAWYSMESENTPQTFIKMILPNGTQEECTEDLESKSPKNGYFQNS